MERASCGAERHRSVLAAQHTDSNEKDSTPVPRGRPFAAGAAPTHQARTYLLPSASTVSDPKRTNGLLAVFGDPRLADGYAADRRLPFPADLISGRGGDANPE
jgi:hypothetical protein